MKSYKTVLRDSYAEFIERKSRFIAHVAKVDSESNANDFINDIKNKYWDARHNCYAYVVEDDNNLFVKYSDDGEPQGTAGLPILDVIKKNELKNVCIVVTRYFGGILLGASGLVRAYSKAAALGVKEAGVVNMVCGNICMLTVSYSYLEKIQYVLNQAQFFVDSVDYAENVKFNIFTPKGRYDELSKMVTDITSGECELLLDVNEVFRPLQINT